MKKLYDMTNKEKRYAAVRIVIYFLLGAMGCFLLLGLSEEGKVLMALCVLLAGLIPIQIWPMQWNKWGTYD